MGSFIQQLELFSLQLFRYEMPIIFAIGVVGNVVNIMTFARSALRKNVCSSYFICLSVAHLILLIFSCLPRIIAAATGYDYARYSLTFCRFRAFATDSSLGFARHFLCLIAIDRWLITSSNFNIRNHSSMRLIKYVIIISFLFWTLINSHTLIKYELTALGCSPSLGTPYELFYSIYNIVTSLLPLFIMSLFTVLAVRNIRRPTAASNRSTRNPLTLRIIRRIKRDKQLIRLSIFQVLAFILLNTLRAVFPLYSFLLNARGPLTSNERSLALFISGMGANLLFTYTAVRFSFLVPLL